MAHILLIDDEALFADCLREELESHGHAVEYLPRVEDGVARLDGGRFDLVLLDNIMPRMTGLQFLKALKAHGLKVPVILMTGDPSADTAIRTINLGAFAYVIKHDVTTLAHDLQRVIARAVEVGRPPKEVQLPGHAAPGSPDGPMLVGNSARMNEVYALIGAYADSDDSVLILGETGTGKELVAGALHGFSPRKDRPFVALNCAAIPASLLEGELFGNEKGAFTGAEKVRKGMIEYADGGTLFLDEIGEMSPDLQTKLLRVLQERKIVRVGGNEPIPVDFRLVSATHRHLRQAIRDGKFRADLYHRLFVLEIRLPPLRDRLDDLPHLIDFFLTQAAAKAGRSTPAVSSEAMVKLRAHSWPGNVRELQNAVRRAFALCREPVILPAHIELADDESPPPAPAGPPTEADAVAALRKAIDWALAHHEKDVLAVLEQLLERELLAAASDHCKGNKQRIADKLGVVWNTVSKRLKRHGLK